MFGNYVIFEVQGLVLVLELDTTFVFCQIDHYFNHVHVLIVSCK